MALSPLLRKTLKALSYTEPDIKKTYLLERQLADTKLSDTKLGEVLYSFWDHKVFVGSHNIPVRIFSPVKSKTVPGQFPILLFFHGGGWVKGDINSYSKLCSTLARLTRHVVVSVDYRLAPEYKFPAAVLDCYKIALELFTKAELLNVSSNRITLIGDSAGGNLAAAVSLMARDRGEFMPPKQILIYPATYSDHSPASPFPSIRENGTDYLLTSKRVCDYMELYVGSQDDYNNPYFAPLLAKDFSCQPDTLIITAEFDPLRDEGEAYGEKLRAAGNNVRIHRIPDALHGFFALSPRFKMVRQSYDLINDFLGVDINDR